jgi:transcriptional regulator with XRE-family HTH domain
MCTVAANMGREKKDDLLERLAWALRQRRQKRRITQADLARAVGVTVANLNNFEKCRNFPSFAVYVELCNVLGCPKPPLT